MKSLPLLYRFERIVLNMFNFIFMKPMPRLSKSFPGSIPAILRALLLAVFFLQSLTAFSQEECATQPALESLLLSDERFREDLESVNQHIAALIEAGRLETEDELITIPVAVHVFHLGEPVGTGSNISDQQIIDAIDAANTWWRNASGNGVDLHVEFCLAQQDPDGNPHSGINRIDGRDIPLYEEYGIAYGGETGANELFLKNQSNWRHNFVYNVWVVHNIAGGWGGYAQFPFTFNYDIDGTVIRSTSMRASSSTLAHEFGHGFQLWHTFQGGDNSCPPNAICQLFGDQVCDTPPHKKSDCSSTSCSNDPNLDNSFRNVMSYCGNRDRFTAGQKARVHAALASTSRNALINSPACSPACTAPPAAGFDFIIGENGFVQFQNTSSGAYSSHWYFGDDAESTENEPEHQYLQTGAYSVTLIVSNPCGSDTITQLVELDATGIRNFNTHAIGLYPNPGHGTFTITFDHRITGKVIVEVMNTMGQAIWSEEVHSGSNNSFLLNSGLPAGYYVLTWKSENGRGATRLLIQ